MYNEHHAQTLSREMAVQNVKEFASNGAISSDGSFHSSENRWPTLFLTPVATRNALGTRWGKEWVGVFL